MQNAGAIGPIAAGVDLSSDSVLGTGTNQFSEIHVRFVDAAERTAAINALPAVGSLDANNIAPFVDGPINVTYTYASGATITVKSTGYKTPSGTSGYFSLDFFGSNSVSGGAFQADDFVSGSGLTVAAGGGASFSYTLTSIDGGDLTVLGETTLTISGTQYGFVVTGTDPGDGNRDANTIYFITE